MGLLMNIFKNFLKLFSKKKPENNANQIQLDNFIKYKWEILDDKNIVLHTKDKVDELCLRLCYKKQLNEDYFIVITGIKGLERITPVSPYRVHFCLGEMYKTPENIIKIQQKVIKTLEIDMFENDINFNELVKYN